MCAGLRSATCAPCLAGVVCTHARTHSTCMHAARAPPPARVRLQARAWSWRAVRRCCRAWTTPATTPATPLPRGTAQVGAKARRCTQRVAACCCMQHYGLALLLVRMSEAWGLGGVAAACCSLGLRHSCVCHHPGWYVHNHSLSPTAPRVPRAPRRGLHWHRLPVGQQGRGASAGGPGRAVAGADDGARAARAPAALLRHAAAAAACRHPMARHCRMQ